ncbi:I78 family peptidase inhibitor [Sulfitobacter mediterraneus]|uniref:I78 family peptidase inhibitor n=1 Tax=Sulfitobacter mediterraneus TaxID=83219 RepID=UPI0013C4E422|nr:I78 family peptidase inhibitor [Sulfitobacter mediterraneus]
MRGPIALTLLVLAGCSGEPAINACGADQWRNLLGKPEAALSVVGKDLRIIHPGDAVTMDFNPARLNAEIDAQGKIAKLACY